MRISKLFYIDLYKPFIKSIHKTNPYATQIFRELVPAILLLLKEHIRLGYADIVDHSNLLIPD